jgi:hypothetical protein
MFSGMDVISSPIQAVIDIFADPLRELRFADVDAATLGDLAASAQAAADVVLAAELELAQARRSLQERQEALLQHAQRALAYARVYAEGDPALCERLEQIAMPRGSRRSRLEGDALVLEPAPASKNRRGASDAGDTKRARNLSRKAREEGPALDVELASTG